jgi:hypothetical protein
MSFEDCFIGTDANWVGHAHLVKQEIVCDILVGMSQKSRYAGK